MNGLLQDTGQPNLPLCDRRLTQPAVDQLLHKWKTPLCFVASCRRVHPIGSGHSFSANQIWLTSILNGDANINTYEYLFFWYQLDVDFTQTGKKSVPEVRQREDWHEDQTSDLDPTICRLFLWKELSLEPFLCQTKQDFARCHKFVAAITLVHHLAVYYSFIHQQVKGSLRAIQKSGIFFPYDSTACSLRNLVSLHKRANELPLPLSNFSQQNSFQRTDHNDADIY